MERSAPGSRLPTRDEFCEQFKVSRMTVQRALDQLTREGFVVPQGRRGTFVAEYPPHLSHLAIVFHDNPAAGFAFSRFWEALYRETIALQRNAAQHRKISIFFDIEKPEHEDFDKLEADVRANRVAGVIVTNYVAPRLQRLFDAHPRVPRVAIAGPPTFAMKTPRVQIDVPSFYDRALDHIARAGRKRVAAYLRSRRRIAFSQWGIYRYFKELDG